MLRVRRGDPLGSRYPLRADVLLQAAATSGDETSMAIAQRAGLRQSTVARLLRGDTTPSVPTLVALRDAYGFDTIDVLVTHTREQAMAA